VRDHDNAFRIVQDFFRYALVGSTHDFFEHISGILQPLYRILFGGGRSHGAQYCEQTEYQSDKRSFQWILLGDRSMALTRSY
jgi:hypothetical protein